MLCDSREELNAVKNLMFIEGGCFHRQEINFKILLVVYFRVTFTNNECPMNWNAIQLFSDCLFCFITQLVSKRVFNPIADTLVEILHHIELLVTKFEIVFIEAILRLYCNVIFS